MYLRKSLLTGIFLIGATLSSQSMAAFVDPATESWGGWTRNTGNTVYAHWDSFSLDGPSVIPSPPAPVANPDGDLTPDVNNYGTQLAATVPLNPATFGTSTDNWYTAAGPGAFVSYVFADNLINPPGFGPVTAALQIKTQGTPLDTSSVILQDGATTNIWTPDSSTLLSNSGGVQEWLFLWDLSADISTYFFSYTATGAHMSLDQVAIDIGPSPVPVPAAIWLFVSGLLGMVGVARRK